jgi:uncharacterized protein YdeI (YjbR/CyaY-like superfamily)
MKIKASLYVSTREDWHAWLEQYHQSESEVWLIYYKAHAGQPSIPYEDSVEEALCFGWIDSIIQKLDDDRYARKFTPRTNTANWSDLNKRRIAKLVREGRMTEAGLAKIEDLPAFLAGPSKEKPKELIIPPYIEQVLKEHPLAWENFCHMAPSYRRIYIGWISSAKRQETIDKRLEEAIQRLEQNLPLGMK